MSTIIRFYTIKFWTYHNEIVGRLQFTDSQGQKQESAAYSLAELANIIDLWKTGMLLGSFANGYKLADDAQFQMVQE